MNRTICENQLYFSELKYLKDFVRSYKSSDPLRVPVEQLDVSTSPKKIPLFYFSL
jgi:hypothetical protein